MQFRERYDNTNSLRDHILTELGREAPSYAFANQKEILAQYRVNFRMSEQGAMREYRELLAFLKEETEPQSRRPAGKHAVMGPAKRRDLYLAMRG